MRNCANNLGRILTAVNTTQPASRPSIIPPALTIGWATSVGMWLVGFMLHLPGLAAPAAAIGIVLLFIHLASGLAIARFVDRACLGRTALLAGAITGLINLLVVGALLSNPEERNTLKDGAMLAMLGYPVISAMACFIGAWIGSRPFKFKPRVEGGRTASAWLSTFAIVTAMSALPVLLSGGLVTSHEAGLAVPDWPTSFGANMFLYPLSRMTGGIYYEHTHRLFGSLVGLTTMALFVFTLCAERRMIAKIMATLALVFVIAQGVLGGMRVTGADDVPDATAAAQQTVDNASSAGRAMLHGITAQLFFAYICVLAAVLSTTWRAFATGDRSPAPEHDDKSLRTLTTLALVVVLMQLLMGSATRHVQHQHIAFMHAGFAMIVLMASLLAGVRAITKHKDERILRKFGHASTHSVGSQIALGIVTFLLVLPYNDEPDSTAAILIATAHQFVGALVIGFASLLCAWSYRFRATN